MQVYPSFSLRSRVAGLNLPVILTFAVLTLLLTGVALSQTAAMNANSEIVQTPRQVMDGRATLLQHYDPTQKLRLAFALTPPRLAEERTLIEQLHDKKSPEFHKFLTADQWNARFAPAAGDEEAVVQWATREGMTVTQRYANRLLVDVEAPAAVIEQALNIRINNYKFGEGTYFSNDRDPSLPGSLTGVVQSVLGLNSFTQLRPSHQGAHVVPRPDYVPGPVAALQPEQHENGIAKNSAEGLAKAMSRAAGGPQITNGNYDPTDLYNSEGYDVQALYNQGHCCNPANSSSGSPPETSIAIAAFGDLNYNDVYAFHDQYPYLAENFQKIYIDGAYTCNNSPNLDDNCLEVTLDTQWSLSMANSFGSYLDTSKIWIYEGANYSYATIADVYNQMLSDGNARVFSTSWGAPESGYGDAGMVAADNIFTSMIGQGWTLVAASGDQGAAAGCGDATEVQFPSSDPNVVGAGGTLLSLDYGPTYLSEVGWTGDAYTGACGKNHGGSTGGYSSYWGVPSYQSNMGFGSRSVPDISLNAAAYQNMYYAPAGGLVGVGGTSIVAPELAGFFAQENAYGLSMGNVCGSGASPCAPIGNANYDLYNEGKYRSAAHYPYYDITSGCNTNDVTAAYGLGYYCAGSGFDQVTGWGSANLLQLAWSFNWFDAAAYGSPAISFGGPTTNKWYNSDQLIDWDVVDNSGVSGVPGTGIAGFTQGWDSLQYDIYSEATPGTGNSFYSGPQHVNSTFGCTDLTGDLCSGGVSQGCHTVYVQAWNNMGRSSGVQSYGPVCYDSIAPSANISLSGSRNGSIYTSAVRIVLSASDGGSGVASIHYQLDGGTAAIYSSPLTISARGPHSISYYSLDGAGNKSVVGVTSFSIESATSTTLRSSINPSVYGDAVKLSATVAANFGGAPTGTVTFRNGTAIVGSAGLVGGQATINLSTISAGSNSITAQYNGDSYDEASTSGKLVETVKQAGTSTSLAASSSSSEFEKTVVFTATVKTSTSGTPEGKVTFRNGSSALGTVLTSGGKAVLSVSNLPVGSHAVTAEFDGSADYLTSTSASLSHTVLKAGTTTSVVSSLNPSSWGKKVTFTAAVKSTTTGLPTGTVTFKAGSFILGTVSVNGGKAEYSTSALSVGSHPITAAYNGNADYLASASPALSETVEAAATTTTLASSLNPSKIGEKVTFTAAVASSAGVPTGTVSFMDGTTQIGTAVLGGGKASFSTTKLTTGTHPIEAVYSGATDFAKSKSAALSQKVTQ